MKALPLPEVGSRFTHLVVLKNGLYAGGKKCQERACLCRCDCGREILAKNRYLRDGQTKSCGCRNGLGITPRNTANGESGTKLYAVWTSMMKRCYEPQDSHYKNYGGRGITVCDEWRSGFIEFKTWALANGYKKGLSIDRINNNGNYEPSNCHWATAREQSNNRRSNTLVTYDGRTQTVSMWAREKNMGVTTLLWRLKNWDIERALSEPVKHEYSPTKNKRKDFL